MFIFGSLVTLVCKWFTLFCKDEWTNAVDKGDALFNWASRWVEYWFNFSNLLFPVFGDNYAWYLFSISWNSLRGSCWAGCNTGGYCYWGEEAVPIGFVALDLGGASCGKLKFWFAAGWSKFCKLFWDYI